MEERDWKVDDALGGVEEEGKEMGQLRYQFVFLCFQLL